MDMYFILVNLVNGKGEKEPDAKLDLYLLFKYENLEIIKWTCQSAKP